MKRGCPKSRDQTHGCITGDKHDPALNNGGSIDTGASDEGAHPKE